LLIGDQILRALIMMHNGSDPILHLEINAKNVLYHILGPEDEEHGFAVKLTDFGIHTTTSLTSITTHPRLKVDDHAPAAIDCDLWYTYIPTYIHNIHT
jgi:serine/threonine protein kinase